MISVMQPQKDVINQKDIPSLISVMQSQKDVINQKDFPSSISVMQPQKDVIDHSKDFRRPIHVRQPHP